MKKGRKHKLKAGRTYKTYDGKEIQLLSFKRIGFDASKIWNITYDNEYKKDVPEKLLKEYLYGKKQSDE